MTKSESTRENLVSDADNDIRLWLMDNPHGTYIITDGLIREIQEWGHTLSCYNPSGLKRRIGKLLKEDGYIKRPNISPPIWDKPGWVVPPAKVVDGERPYKRAIARILERFGRH